MRITAIKVDELKPINGGESNIDPTTPSGALIEFYRAYNNHDLALMEKNWLAGSDSSMNNPLGGIRHGWPEIRELYARIFASPASVRVEFYDYRIYQCEMAFLAVGRERGLSHSPKTTLALQSRTSRFFVLADGRWRQFHHHGSIDDPKLLGLYQAAVM
ncbi:MAG TPA: nuclear transport factor 2 family protein [Verrucomicrobiae bacterium]|jgi:hypothetical protein|nr:nuclear transport factor 2 family protein [Verrucomicrobiae bacterium]